MSQIFDSLLIDNRSFKRLFLTSNCQLMAIFLIIKDIYIFNCQLSRSTKDFSTQKVVYLRFKLIKPYILGLAIQ